MTGSAKRALTALGMFILIAVVVLGGMTWASFVSFELAKRNITEENESRVIRALAKMESHIVGLLNSEASRPFTDYIDFHVVKPEAVFTRNRLVVNADFAVMRSPLAVSGRRTDSIELYFQLDEKGRLTSPQFDEDDSRGPYVPGSTSDDGRRRTRETWNWFRKVQPTLDLRARVTDVLKQDELLGIGSDPEPTKVVRVSQPSQDARGTRRTVTAKSQTRYLPAEVCVAADVAARNLESLPVAIESESEGDDSQSSSTTVSATAGPFAPPFWIDSAPPELGRKLAFVREGHRGAEIVYQGFIGDWAKLKPDLLAVIADDFPAAELDPIPNDVELGDDALDRKLQHLPVLLRVPELAGGTNAAAWSSIWGMLTITWTAAIAVLVIAAWGVSNLVKLTERRLQFAYAVTHELRTPLTTFRLYSDMLSAGLVPDDVKQEYLDTLNRESQRLSTLVEAVLEYARLENQKLKLHISQTDPASLLRVLSETLEKRCEKHGVEPRAESSVPASHPLRTDVNLVNQITAVLVDNACRHAKTSRSPTIRLQLAGDNGHLHLDVIDSGPGIELADARSIFKPFRRGKDADVAARGGVGLGLALARNWATLLGGRLDLVARHDAQLGGAHFRLTIPSFTDN